MTTGRMLGTMIAAAVVVAAGCASEAEELIVREAAGVDAAPLPSDAPAQPAAGAIRFTIAPTGNAARYRVREQLLGFDRPNDAVGETSQISGTIVVDSTGALVAGQSRVVVQTGAFRSDSDRRDNYVRGRLLQAEEHPTVTLVPTAVRGLPARLPAAGAAAGPVTFELVGDLTVRGVTRPTTWRVTARQAGNQVTGSASTRFTFVDFAIEPPRVRSVLSVADTIALEYDFTLARSAAP